MGQFVPACLPNLQTAHQPDADQVRQHGLFLGKVPLHTTQHLLRHQGQFGLSPGHQGFEQDHGDFAPGKGQLGQRHIYVLGQNAPGTSQRCILCEGHAVIFVALLVQPLAHDLQ